MPAAGLPTLPALICQHRGTRKPLLGDVHLRCQGRRCLATESAAAARRLGQSEGRLTTPAKRLIPTPEHAALHSKKM